MPKFIFAKLVRDKIVDLQIKSGAKPKYRILDEQAHKEALIQKITEEAEEILDAKSQDVAEEIADVQQALDDLASRFGLNRDDIDKAQRAKLDKHGGFSKGIYVEYVELDESDPWVAYYRKNADRYKEIKKD